MAQRCCLRNDCICFIFLIIVLCEFWGSCTVSLFITKNIRNATLTLKIISQCFFILFKHKNFILLLIQIFSNYLCYKLLLQILVNYCCDKIFKACVLYFLSNFYLSQNDSPLKTMKNIFYFI